MGNALRYRSKPRRIHSASEGGSPYYKYGASQITGWRFSQEDRYICLPKFFEEFSLFGLYDGHGGSHCAQYLFRYLHQHILKELIISKDPELALYLGFLTTDLCLKNISSKEFNTIEDDLDLVFQEQDPPGASKNSSGAASSAPGTSQEIPQTDIDELKGQITNVCLKLKTLKSLTKIFCKRTGSTATVLLLNDKTLYIANVGDSRCVACMEGQAVDLTVDHKLTKEEIKTRINNAGTFVEDSQVSGILRMSRAFGDFEFKEENVAEPFQMLSCEPFITSLPISDKLEFLIIASAGIWNTMDSQEAVNYVKNRLEDTDMELQDICGEMFEIMLPTAATDDGSGCDNLTAILIVFKKEMGYNTEIAGVQECYKYNNSSFWRNRENDFQGKRSTSEQKSTSPSLHNEELQNVEFSSEDHWRPQNDDSVPIEPIHCDDTCHPSKRFKVYPREGYYVLEDENSQACPPDNNSQARPLNLVRHARDICDVNEPDHGEGSKTVENISVTDYFLNCFQDTRNFIEMTREKIKMVDNDLRLTMNEMDMRISHLLKSPVFADQFGQHSYYTNMNNIHQQSELNSDIASTSVNTKRRRNKSSQSTSEVVVVDLTTDDEEINMKDNSGATQILDEDATSAIDNSMATEEVVSIISNEEEPPEEMDDI